MTPGVSRRWRDRSSLLDDSHPRWELYPFTRRALEIQPYGLHAGRQRCCGFMLANGPAGNPDQEIEPLILQAAFTCVAAGRLHVEGQLERAGTFMRGQLDKPRRDVIARRLWREDEGPFRVARQDLLRLGTVADA